MRYELIAKEDIDERIGDRHFEVKAGETIEVSAQGAEVALSTGKFDYAKEVPETNIEKEQAKEAKKAAQAEQAEGISKKVKTLMKSSKEELLVEADKLKLDGVSALDKESLAKAIAEAQIKGETK